VRAALSGSATKRGDAVASQITLGNIVDIEVTVLSLLAAFYSTRRLWLNTSAVSTNVAVANCYLSFAV